MRDNNFCFLFAQNFHPAMKYASVPRKEVGIQSLFNLMGPLISPAKPKRVLIGVSSKELGKLVSQTLKEMDIIYGLVVCGANGLDEINPAGKTWVMYHHLSIAIWGY